ncbi:uncharacterized protein [Watersipora subatra]|uniref:uncharacterized protein n=1 Tax=Watersipora subatra TaxID=2589382 RepID=UPI00355AF637
MVCKETRFVCTMEGKIKLLLGISLRLMLARGNGNEKLFNKVALPKDNLLDISNISIATREIRCAEQCISQEECYGFIYESSNKSCGLFGCFNLEEEKYLVGENGIKIYVMAIDHHLAQGKPVTMSSVLKFDSKETPFYGSFAVDGIYRPPVYDELFSLAHTLKETNPWLRVDLGTIHCIWAVRILNRGDSEEKSWYERLRDVTITASIVEDDIFDDVSSNSLCGQFPGILHQFFTTITCQQPMKAKLVQLQIKGHGTVNIYEFEVHGFKN